MGPHAPVINHYLAALSRAPTHHLELLRRRDARILFGPTIPDALRSDWATSRRGRPLTAAEFSELKWRYSQEAETAAVYDPEVDALVLPTSYVARDLERIVLHELGHALTMRDASIRPSLLADLPDEIAHHVHRPGYGGETDADTLRWRVLEVLAEGYVYLVVGREEALPPAVLSELVFILTTVAEGETRIRFDFDADTGRTATRVERSDLIDADDPEMGYLLVPRPATNEQLEVADLDSDDLAVRRWRRRAA